MPYFCDNLTSCIPHHRPEMPTSRSSVSSLDSERGGRSSRDRRMAMSQRWTTLETLGRCMFLFSVAFFIVGVLITVFGFSNTGINPSHQVPLQILGPSCLALTLVMWLIGCIFSRLWNLEWKRQQQALELRDRVQLHALAMDILNNPVISPAMLQDPRMRRQLLLKLRAQRAIELSSNEGDSRRTSRAMSMASRRASSVQYDKLAQAEGSVHSGRKSRHDDKAIANGRDVPGIQISRFETLDFGSDRGNSICSGRGSKRYIVIHSDVPSEFSRLSCPSDYSLAGSRSSRSRSSRASSGVSSRLWDFSPRDSEWDADISLGSRESQLSVMKQDWAGGPSPYAADEEYTLSPNAPRKLSVVTFDIGSPNFRRHSSPAQIRRKESMGAECTCGAKSNTNEHSSNSNGHHSRNHHSKNCQTGGEGECHQQLPSQSRASILSSFHKRSMEQSLRSLTIEEDEPEMMEETSPLGAHEDTGSSQQRTNTRQLRPPLRRNNTDDSEVERRVARLFKEIELSTTDSVDESKIHSFSSEFDRRHVEMREVEIQTLTEQELALLMNSENDCRTVTITVPPTGGKRDHPNNSGSCSHNEEEEAGGGEGEAMQPATTKLKKSKFAMISSALASFSASLGKEKKKLIPRRILLQGLSKDEPYPPEVKSPPPKYEDIINKNFP